MSNLPPGVPPGFYCPHGINPKTCWHCLRAPKQATPQRPASEGPPVSPVQQAANSVIAAYRRAPATPDHLSAPTAATIIAPPHMLPPPVITRPRKAESLDDRPKPERQTAIPSPFSYENRTAPIPSGDREWEPPPLPAAERTDFIDRAQGHPEGGRK